MTEDIKNKIKMVTGNDDRFHFAEHVVIPNSNGCFEHNNMWFFYSVDEKAYENICGPFTVDGLIYALALEYDTTDLVDSLSFSEAEWDVYYNNHFYSMEDVLKSTESLPSIGVNGNVLERLKKFDDECFKCTEKHIFIADDTDSTEANQIIPIEEIADKVQRDILEGNKIPHSTSRLVIRKKGKELVFAVFVFFFSKEDIENGMVDRPTLWAEIDMRTGVISSRYDTHNKDFSSASYEEKYNVRTDKKYDTSRDYYKKALELLDKVRLTYIESARFLEREYREYMDMILANIPENYRQFYADLSI